MTAQTTAPGFPWVMTILLAFAAIIYLTFVANLLGARGSDAAGRGMALGFAAFQGLALWLVIGILFAIAFYRGSMPGYAMAAAIVFVPLSAIAAASATGLYMERHGEWLIAVPIALPPLLALYAFWARFVGWHDALPSGPTTAILGGAVVVLTIVPLVLTTIEFMPNPERDAAREAAVKAQEAEYKKRQEEAEAAEAAQFSKLGPDSSLRDYLEYLPPGHTRFKDAVAGARLVKTRNADARALLNEGMIGELADLWDLRVDPLAVCQAYGDALKGMASKVSRSQRAYISAALDIEWQLPNIEWLVGAKCDLGDALTEAETRIREVADSARVTKIADRLGELRQRR
jgi:hypothetical protein